MSMKYDPILVVQAEQDTMIDPQSANYIYNHVDSDEKNQMVSTFRSCDYH